MAPEEEAVKRSRKPLRSKLLTAAVLVTPAVVPVALAPAAHAADSGDVLTSEFNSGGKLVATNDNLLVDQTSASEPVDATATSADVTNLTVETITVTPVAPAGLATPATSAKIPPGQTGRVDFPPKTSELDITAP
jgi:hypothetical protein